jgi:3'5'-cyclic nucleotide phosphodiesterase
MRRHQQSCTYRSLSWENITHRSTTQSRPYVVSQYWASALGQEWNSQAYLEKYFGLPATVQPSDNPLIEAKGQIFFISTYVKPLLDLTVQAVPGMYSSFSITITFSILPSQ